MRRLSEMLGWGRTARRPLGQIAADAPPPKVLLRAERAQRAPLNWRLRLDRPAPHRFDIALTLFVLLGAALLGAERGGQLDGVVTEASRAGDWVARSVGLGVTVVTVSGTTHMSEPRILAIAGIDASRSLPFFDVAEAKARLEADPLIKQASVRKLYPTRSSSTSSSAPPTPSGRRTATSARSRPTERRSTRSPTAVTPICRSSWAKARTRGCANMSSCSMRWRN